ncbi:MAG: hypothetical protein MI923_25785 [Phycisphaerales bacterium]|nr:hypothetical protein [Phycisphaerales bacterium]
MNTVYYYCSIRKAFKFETTPCPVHTCLHTYTSEPRYDRAAVNTQERVRLSMRKANSDHKSGTRNI